MRTSSAAYTSMGTAVHLLEVKGYEALRVEKLGSGKAVTDRSEVQQRLHEISRLQNFCGCHPERPDWAHGAFVYVTPIHASEIRAAVEEFEAGNEMRLAKHHMLVSEEYIELVCEALATWPTGAVRPRDAYQSSRSGVVKHKATIPTPIFSQCDARMEANMGQFTVKTQGIQLTTVRTFLDIVDGGSDLSRKTRSTGDRPKYAGLASESEHAKLPPCGADYGPCRKKFQLVQANVALEVMSGSVQDNGLASARALSAASDESVATTFSVRSSEFYNAVMCSRVVIEDIAKELDEELALLRQPLQVISIDDLNSHFGKGADLFKRLITLVFERSPPSAHDTSALSALEAPEVMDNTIKRVSIFLGKQVLDSLGFLMRALSIPDGFGNHNHQRFQESLEKAFAKAATKHLMHDIYTDRLRSAVNLESLQNSIFRAIDDVLHQQLRQKAASLVAAQAKLDRRAYFVEEEKASFNSRKVDKAELELTRRIVAKQIERDERVAAEREQEKMDLKIWRKSWSVHEPRQGPWGAPNPKPDKPQQRQVKSRFPKDAAQAWRSQPNIGKSSKPPTKATIGMWIDAKIKMKSKTAQAA